MSTISTKLHKTILLDGAHYTSPLTITSTGTIAPHHDAQGDGLAGIIASITGAQIANYGHVIGGAGAKLSGKAGGIGIDLTAAGTLANHGAIYGGAGGSSQQQGGTGAAGVVLQAGGTIVNYGNIFGGAGGNSDRPGGSGGHAYAGGTGGIGVIVASGMLINGDRIAGGAGGTGANGNMGAAGAAVQLYAGATLEVLPTAVFIGQVEAAGSNNALILGGTTAATLAGLGTQFTGFTSLIDSASSTWTLTSGGRFAGAITVDGTLTVSTGVTLGSGAYSSTGAAITFGNAAGVFVNDTTILGGAAKPNYGQPGGIGATVTGSGTLANSGTIGGGAGDTNGVGGTGVSFLSTGTVWNAGLVQGGTGGGAGIQGSVGGVGVDLAAGGSISNAPAATIQGGLAGTGFVGYHQGNGYGGIGGVGVMIAGGGILANAGTISGGNGAPLFRGNYAAGGSGGAGVVITGGFQFINTGTVLGGHDSSGYEGGGYGGIGVSLAGGGSFSNTGTIAGGNGSYGGRAGRGDHGGVGLSISGGGVFADSGTILGGNGTAGGNGVNQAGGTLTLSGALIAAGKGGSSDGSGGIGLSLSGGVVIGSGTILAGSGGSSYYYGGAGGTGINVSNGSVSLVGTIIAGNGGYGGIDTGGKGGDGIVLTGGFVSVNGLIQGGHGGIGDGGRLDGQSGVGVALNGGTLVVAGGTVSGGQYANGSFADAVQFGSQTGNLILDATTIFNGAVVAKASAADVLTLAGTIASTLTGLGSEFTGFASLTESAGANWTLQGSNTLAGPTTIGGTLAIGGSLAFTGTLTDNGALLVDSGGSLTVAGTLTGTGSTQIASGGALVGTGTFQTPFDVEGLLETQSTSLTMTGPISGSGTLDASTGTTLMLESTENFKGTLTGTGIIAFGEQQGSGLDWNGPELTNSGTLIINDVGSHHIQGVLTNLGTITLQSNTFAFLNGVTNVGLVTDAARVLVIDKAVSGTGTITIGATSTLALQDGASSGQTINFLATTGALDLTRPASFAGLIAGFAASDQIDLVATAATGASYANNTLTVTDNGTQVAALHFNGSYTINDFALSSDGQGGTFIKFV